MHFILEPLFTLFGRRAIGQLAGGTLVGAVLPALTFRQQGENPPGGYFVWTVAGAVAGFFGGLFLLSPKRFFGSIFALLGIALAIVPMSHADSSPATAHEYSVKIGIGLVSFFVGAILLVRAWRRLK